MQVAIPAHIGESQVIVSFPVGFEQLPVPGSHEPATWQASRAAQTTDEPAAQVPAPSQVSPVVHLFPSLHVTPGAAGGFEHEPFIGSHTPAV
jgi:hypothetical protein